MHLQFIHKYTRISPKIGYSMSEKKKTNRPQNMNFFCIFSMQIVRNAGARNFTRSSVTQVFFDTHPQTKNEYESAYIMQ